MARISCHVCGGIFLFLFAYSTNFFTDGVEIIIFDEILNFLFGKLAFSL